jgi:hypothetical protein
MKLQQKSLPFLTVNILEYLKIQSFLFTLYNCVCVGVGIWPASVRAFMPTTLKSVTLGSQALHTLGGKTASSVSQTQALLASSYSHV